RQLSLAAAAPCDPRRRMRWPSCHPGRRRHRRAARRSRRQHAARELGAAPPHPSEDAIPVPAGLDLAQAAMLRINPATALLLLEDHVALAPGDWVIQNVANSAVGRHLIVLAKARGVRTINVVRRDDIAAELRALGGDVVLSDGPDLVERARAAAGSGPVRLGIDAVSGAATKRIADCVGDGGVVASYGSMSGEDPVMS